MHTDKFLQGGVQMGKLIRTTDWADISDQISLPKGIRHGTVFNISKLELEKLLELK